MWCVPEIDDEYLTKMEDVLFTYEKKYNPKEPVVCIDERPVMLRDNVRPEIPMEPGKIKKQDSEYKRNGKVNAFLAVEPKAGKHFTKITKNRKAPEFAKMVKSIVDAYPRARTIHLVMDNLNTHCEKSLILFYGEKLGRKIWKKIMPHYTPKHGSWLNQAEIEISIFSRQCLGKDRTASIQDVRLRAKAWNRKMNREKTKIAWSFTRKRARKKFNYKA